MHNEVEKFYPVASADELLKRITEKMPPSVRAVAYICGAYVLEAISGCRQPPGIKIACNGGAAEAVRAVAEAVEGRAVQVEVPNETWLVHDPVSGRRVVIVSTGGKEIESHLKESSFTVLALGYPLELSSQRGIIDPAGGLADRLNRVLRTADTGAVERDPGCILLGAGLAAEYGLQPEEEMMELFRGRAESITRLPGERLGLLTARLFGGSRMSVKARFLKDSGVLEHIIPELKAIYDVPQNFYHHLDVWGHTMEALDHLEEILAFPEECFRENSQAVIAHLERTVESGLTRRSILGLGTLIHDVGKAECMQVLPTGRIRFKGHNEAGYRHAGRIASRLRFGKKASNMLIHLAGEHMDIGFLLDHGESERNRLALVRMLKDDCLDIAVLSIADRMATRGEAAVPELLERFKRTSLRIVKDYFWDRGTPEFVGGEDVVIHKGEPAGPHVGEALFNIRVAQREGIIKSRQQALEYLSPDFKGRMA